MRPPPSPLASSPSTPPPPDSLFSFCGCLIDSSSTTIDDGLSPQREGDDLTHLTPVDEGRHDLGRQRLELGHEHVRLQRVQEHPVPRKNKKRTPVIKRLSWQLGVVCRCCWFGRSIDIRGRPGGLVGKYHRNLPAGRQVVGPSPGSGDVFSQK